MQNSAAVILGIITSYSHQSAYIQFVFVLVDTKCSLRKMEQYFFVLTQVLSVVILPRSKVILDHKKIVQGDVHKIRHSVYEEIKGDQ